jgi:hypothetical protein
MPAARTSLAGRIAAARDLALTLTAFAVVIAFVVA